jgi:hypothetical protein
LFGRLFGRLFICSIVILFVHLVVRSVARLFMTFKNIEFKTRPLAAKQQKECLLYACAHGHAGAQTHAQGMHAQCMHACTNKQISPNLGKIITLLKNNLGNKTQKNIWHYSKEILE